MYWYLSIIFEQQCNLIDHIDRFALERAKKLRDARKLEECSGSREWLRSLHQLAEVSKNLSMALWKFYRLLQTLKIIKAPERDFADPQLLYEARMKPFLCIGNDPLPSLQDFESARQNVDSVQVTCSAVQESMKKTKALVAEVKKYSPEQAKYVGTEEQWKKEIKQTETTCVAISVAASQLVRIYEKGASDDMGSLVECSFEKKYHAWWLVPQLKERTK